MRWMHSQAQRGIRVHKDEVKRGFRCVLHLECDPWRTGASLWVVRAREGGGRGRRGKGWRKGREKERETSRQPREAGGGEYTRSRTPRTPPECPPSPGQEKSKRRPPMSLGPRSRQVNAQNAASPSQNEQEEVRTEVLCPEWGSCPARHKPCCHPVHVRRRELLFPPPRTSSRAHRPKPAPGIQPVCERVAATHMLSGAVCTDWRHAWLQRVREGIAISPAASSVLLSGLGSFSALQLSRA